MDAPSDRDLVVRARRGEIEPFGELVRRYQTTVFNVCYRLMGERREAEDMTQETFIRAMDRLGTFNLDLPFAPWIKRVAANLCLNRLESARPESPLDDERHEIASDESPEAAHDESERAKQVRRALRDLPAHYRMVIELRHYQDLSYDEIAQTMKIPLSDVKSHLFRARKILAEQLRENRQGAKIAKDL
jgi:RNA polymerase sigma-70 factor (ECF subfamily)